MLNRRSTFFTVALETLLSAAIGLGILLVPLSVLWIAENSALVDWMTAFRAGADFWLAAHGVGIVIPAGPIAGVAIAQDFVISVWPLGFTAYVLVSTYRIGRRLAASDFLWPGWVAGALVYGGVSLALATLGHSATAYPVEVQGTFQPPTLFVAVLILTSLFAQPADLGFDQAGTSLERRWATAKVREFRERGPWVIRTIAQPALRAGTAVVLMLLAVSAATIGVLLAVNWIEVIKLYESMQLSGLGAILLTLGQLAVAPNLTVFGADWLTGVGFAIGAGSSVSPLGTNLGPIPAMPVFAAIPTGASPLWLVAVVVPIAAAILATVWVRDFAQRVRFEFASPLSAAISLGLGIGVVAALEMALLTWLAGGAIGPGRMQVVGGNPLLVGLATLIEVGAASCLVAFYSAKPEGADQEVLARAKR